MSASIATVIHEFNCNGKRVQATVWLRPRAVTEDSEEYEKLPEVPGIIRCFGPGDQALASQVSTAIALFLQKLELPFIQHVIADN